MTGLTEDINSQEEAIEYARKDPNKALGIVVWNLVKLKEQCSTRIVSCKSAQRKSRLKNAAMQFGGGVIGGSAAVAVIWAWVKDNIVSMIGRQ